jgi:hypothetical protein
MKNLIKKLGKSIKNSKNINKSIINIRNFKKIIKSYGLVLSYELWDLTVLSMEIIFVLLVILFSLTHSICTGLIFVKRWEQVFNCYK